MRRAGHNTGPTARLTNDHFPKNAANGPHVHAFAVARGPQQDFRGAVPASGHVISEDLHFPKERSEGNAPREEEEEEETKKIGGGAMRNDR